MVGINSYVYNSDCLYINPARRIFAVSDPPGITTCSRRLMERLDRAVQDQMEDIEQTVNRLSEQTRPEDGATLSLVAFPDGTPGQAVVVIAGDTFVFRGNINARTFQQLSGTHDFIGTPYVTYKAQEIPYEPGDFFIIASDGIVSLVGKDPERNLERAFLTLMKDGRDGLVYRAVCAANGYYHEKIYDRLFSRFGGNDNISMLAIFPEQLEKDSTAESIILGGYLEERL
jgi:serine/threonine protein phosphatase PrpC